MKKVLLLPVLLLLSLNLFAVTNISCDTQFGNKLFVVKDSTIDVYNTYSEGRIYSFKIKSETDNYIYSERLLPFHKEIWSYLFIKADKGRTVTHIKDMKFDVIEIIKDEYVQLRIKQTLEKAEWYGSCVSLSK